MKDRILDIYKKHSPSIRDQKKVSEGRRKSIFLDKLKLPIELFKGKAILEFGPGTGETSKYYAKWGGNIEFVETNESSCKRLHQVFREKRLEENITGIHNLDFESFAPANYYDFCCAEGCLYLADNPEKAFNNLVGKLKRNGFVIIAEPETFGSLQIILKAILLNKIADGNYEKIVKYAKLFFLEDLERAHKAGGRPIENIIYDKYIIPRLHSIPIDTVLMWFRKNNIRYYSSCPEIWPVIRNDSHFQDYLDLTDENMAFLSVISKCFLMKAKSYDKDRFSMKKQILKQLNSVVKKIEELCSNVDLQKTEAIDILLPCLRDLVDEASSLDYQELCSQEVDIKNSIPQIFKEMIIFIDLIINSSNEQNIRNALGDFKHLFHGFSGISTQYYVGYKL